MGKVILAVIVLGILAFIGYEIVVHWKFICMLITIWWFWGIVVASASAVAAAKITLGIGS